MTDVTGFGLLGHLVEMADGAQLTAQLDYAAVPRLPGVDYYLAEGCVPGGTLRNFDSYGEKIAPISEAQQQLAVRPANQWWPADRRDAGRRGRVPRRRRRAGPARLAPIGAWLSDRAIRSRGVLMRDNSSDYRALLPQ